MLASAPFALGTLVCYVTCFRNNATFNVDSIKERVGNVDSRAEADHKLRTTV